MRWLLFVLAVGCAPTHVPRAGTLSMLEEQGDVQLSGQMGTHGLSGELSYAVSDAIGVRAGAQTAPTPRYASGWAGIGPYVAFGSVGRFGAYVEAGGGVANSQSEVTFTTNSGSSTSTFVNRGSFVHGGLAVEIGAEWPWVATGFAMRGVYQQFAHGAGSDNTGLAQLMSLESTAAVRFGAPVIKFEWQVGMALPMFLTENQGVYFPIRTSFGLVWDFPEKRLVHRDDPAPPPRPLEPRAPGPVQPTPAPVPAEPVPAEPVPAEPVPAEPVPAERPVPAEPAPE